MNVDDASDPIAEMMHMKTRGANDFWFWKDKPIRELGAAQEVLSSAGLALEQLRSRGDGEDPPDCEAIIGGQRWGIEVTELVHRSTLEATIQGNGRYFRWDQNDLRTEIQKLINRKDKPTAVKGGPYDRYFLVIFTDEFFLNAETVGRFLRGATFHAHAGLITDAYFGLSYEPRFNGGLYPVLSLIPAVRLVRWSLA
jgi:hypothetical protein